MISFQIILLVTLWATSLAAVLWGAWHALKFLRRPVAKLSADLLPPVTILKPLKGCERGLAENLQSFFELDYPRFEIIFSVAQSSDPAVPLVHSLLARYPGVVARLIVGSVDLTANPKVNNLIVPYEQGEHDWILISDSNVRIEKGYLRRMMVNVDGDVGVVTAVVAGQRAESLGGRLEACYLNTFYARWMLMAAAIGRGYVLGKSMLFRRSVADRFGGLRYLGQYVAEDYMMGQAMRRLGLGVMVMADPVGQFIGDYSVRSFWQRHLRWGRIRKAQVPFLFALEPFQSCFLAGACGAIALHGAFGVCWLLFMLTHIALWACSDLLLIRRLEGSITLKTVGAWFFRELIAFPLWAHMALGRTILWRGTRLKVLSGGVLEDGCRPLFYPEPKFLNEGFATE